MRRFANFDAQLLIKKTFSMNDIQANYGLSFKPINFYRLVGRLYNFFDFYENYTLFVINSEI